MKAVLSFLAMAVLASCMTTTNATTGPSPYDDPATTWRAVAVNGQPFSGDAKIIFPGSGRIAGNVACNGFSGMLTAPWPAFATTDMQTTIMECTNATPGFWPAFNAATSASVSGNTLSLLDGSQVVMVLKAEN